MPLKFTRIYGPVLITLWLGLFLDSTTVAAYIANNQLLTNILVLIVFAWVFHHVSRIARQLMIYGVFISFAGEVTLALGLGMYTYRLGNVPLYVPLGHAMVYAAVYYFTREPWVRRHRQHMISLLYPIMIIYSLLWFFWAGDLLGLLCTIIIILLLRRHPETQLFFLIMFFLVVYLELVGTYYQCWQWPPIWFNTITLIPSANPPSGISVVYFALDGLCLLAYRLLHARAWQRRLRKKSGF